MQRNRTYECMCLLDNREVRKGWEPLKQSVASMFTKHGAKLLSNRRWDERRLAYPIRGQGRGTYLLMYFNADTQAVANIRRELQFNEALLRYLLVECQDVPQSAYEPEAEFDVAAIPTDDTAIQPALPAAADKALGAEPSDVGEADVDALGDVNALADTAEEKP